MYKLLIVDDEFIERDALKFIINKHCPQIDDIEQASNGKEAIIKSSTFLPDIIFMDIKMPGINGIEAAKNIKQFHPGCKIVFLTAFDYFDYAQEAVKIGVEDFIIKPATNEQVVEMVNKLTTALDAERIRQTKRQEVENKLEKITQYLKNELVSSLVSGEIEDSQILEYFSVLDVRFNEGFSAVVNINYSFTFSQNNHSEKDISSLRKNMIKKRCMEKLQFELQRHNLYSLISCMGNHIFLLLICHKDYKIPNMKEWSVKIFEKIWKVIYEQLGIFINIGIGHQFDNVHDITLSFSQAKIACKHGINAYQEIIHFDDIEQDRILLAYPAEKEKQLCEKIIRCDENGALVLVDEILDWMIQSFHSIKDIRRKIYELIVILTRTVSREVNLKENTSANYLEELQAVHTIGEIRTYVKHQLEKIIREVNAVKLDRTGSLIEKVCEYIKQNYMKEITLDEMAAMTGFSSYYFSKIFKQYQNINFIDYLTSVRIEKAKEFLKDPTANIKEISNMVGYSDPNYFTRVFKRTEGITPTEYRDKKVLSEQ
ncbi:MAG: two-component system, response regulator YesN [Clostridiales bacterium]|jgi:two-component system response regulator YesN|nr:two-component system, response regulator YesN [Clostridiales bacterium]MDK2933038.1 two-component system, response regulator YesN [Clostridiales bacterium]